MNRLYYGDNLDWLSDHKAFPDACVDLVYLDPPFNSNATYSQLFKSPDGKTADSQIEAFEDTWSWGISAEAAYDRVLTSGNTDVAQLLQAMRGFLHDNAMMAYLAMMAARLIELHRVLKDTGSLYLHCDPTASHYLKLLLDGVFGAANFRNEITWLRSRNPKGSQHLNVRWGPATDIILFYAKSTKAVLDTNAAKKATGVAELAKRYPKSDASGRWADGPILRSASMGKRPNLVYEYKGYTPGEAGWRCELDKLVEIDAVGDLYWTSEGNPRRKIRPDENELDPLSNCWTDVSPINSQAQERLGYPTQKPLALLERIIVASSNPGDVVLDPFCGCGTAVHAAEKLGRRWIGIDITYLSIALIEKRLRKAFPGIVFDTAGLPKSLANAEELARRDKYEFQKWIVTWIGGQPWKGGQKGPDGGIDGLIFFQSFDPAKEKATHEKAIISVKGGQAKGVGWVSELVETIGREKAALGILLTAVLPTREMEARAASAGFFETGLHAKVPRIQIVTLAELFQGKRPIVPNVNPAMFKAAPREASTAQGGFDL